LVSSLTETFTCTFIAHEKKALHHTLKKVTVSLLPTFCFN
jgi:hypothetical protein